MLQLQATQLLASLFIHFSYFIFDGLLSIQGMDVCAWFVLVVVPFLMQNLHCGAVAACSIVLSECVSHVM